MKRPGRLIGGGGDFSNGLLYGKESRKYYHKFTNYILWLPLKVKNVNTITW